MQGEKRRKVKSSSFCLARAQSIFARLDVLVMQVQSSQIREISHTYLSAALKFPSYFLGKDTVISKLARDTSSRAPSNPGLEEWVGKIWAHIQQEGCPRSWSMLGLQGSSPGSQRNGTLYSTREARELPPHQVGNASRRSGYISQDDYSTLPGRQEGDCLSLKNLLNSFLQHFKSYRLMQSKVVLLPSVQDSHGGLGWYLPFSPS